MRTFALKKRSASAVPAKSGRKTQLPAARFAAFQPDALEILATPTPVRYRLTLYLLLGFILCAVIFACLAKVDRIVIAPGKLVAARHNVTIAPLETAVIREIHVSAGQSVTKGAPLVTLDPTFAEAGLGEQEKERAALAAKVWRLRCETDPACPPTTGVPKAELTLERAVLTSRHQEFAAKARSYTQQIRELTARLATNAAEVAKAGKQIALARELEHMYGDIYKQGASSKVEFMKAQSSRIDAEGQRTKLKNEAGELRESLAKAQAEKQDFESNWRSQATKELAEASSSLATVEERLRKAARLRDLVILRAPEDGTVLDVAARAAGAVAPQGETLLTLVPKDEELVVEGDVAAQDIGLVRVNDPVRLKFEAFPYQRHGTATARIRTISPDAFENKTQEGQRLFYRVRAAITDAQLSKVPKDFRLFPGMTLSAEIKVGSRRVITYLLYPLIRSFDESLREP